MKRVVIIGGTGFLGYHAIQAFHKAGWGVTAIGLPPAPPQTLFPEEVRIILLPVNSASDEELIGILKSQDALIFAAGLDDRTLLKAPAFPKFLEANVTTPARIFRLAVQAGIKRAVVLGSYFSYFDRVWPELRLNERHPYIRSRVEQEKVLTTIPGLETCILELPYIFGRMPVEGWKPLWTPLINYLRSSKVLFYMKGGTTCISASLVGKVILAAVERGEPGARYPIGQENLTWTQMLQRLAKADGRSVKVIPLPRWIIQLALNAVMLVHKLKGQEGGLNLRYFAPLQTAETFIDPCLSQQALGYELDLLDDAFTETIRACSKQ